MTREEQYKEFKFFLDKEDERYLHLNNRATAYLAFVTGLVSIIGLFSKRFLEGESANCWFVGIFVITGILVLVSVFFCLKSLSIQDYMALEDLESFLPEIDEGNFSKEDVYSRLLADLGTTVTHNRKINNNRAEDLRMSYWFLALSILSGITLYYYAIASV